MTRMQLLRNSLALLALASGVVGCNGRGPGGFTDDRANAEYPYVMYLAGPGSDARSVHIDLDTAGVRVGVGSIDALSVRRATLTAVEVAAARDLFTAAKVAEYRLLDLPSEGSAGAGGVDTVPGPVGEVPEPEDEGGAGDEVDIEPSPPPSTGMRATDKTEIVITAPPGGLRSESGEAGASGATQAGVVIAEGGRAWLYFDPTAPQEPAVERLLEYFDELVVTYAP